MADSTKEHLEVDRRKEKERVDEAVRKYHQIKSERPDDFAALEGQATIVALLCGTPIGSLILMEEFQRALEFSVKQEYYLKQIIVLRELQNAPTQA